MFFPHLYPCASSLLPAVDGSTWEGRDARSSGRLGGECRIGGRYSWEAPGGSVQIEVLSGFICVSEG
ncbi:hypothetical protein Taro_027014 [Colocasia esculenta]|uniref:Uncharacterized protein n=1 Tax=Colocasia esculenta TaxID=4460 RepID=A0A843VL93_COLES|nr:hypothetical protein [Colocasia esculenta]